MEGEILKDVAGYAALYLGLDYTVKAAGIALANGLTQISHPTYNSGRTKEFVKLVLIPTPLDIFYLRKK